MTSPSLSSAASTFASFSPPSFYPSPESSSEEMPKEPRASIRSYQDRSISSAGGRHVMRPTTIWTAEDDEILKAARARGLPWGPIAETHFPNKTPNACRKRHERLMEKSKDEDWDDRKISLLATEYMAVRKDMWSMLSDRMGEKWQVVEAKCMELGFKNLQAAQRSANRRSRDEFDHSSFSQAPGTAEIPMPHSASQMYFGGPMAGAPYQVGPPHPQDPRGRNMSIHAMLSPTPSYSG